MHLREDGKKKNEDAYRTSNKIFGESMRFVPIAMTPIQFKDLYYGLAHHKNGLNAFEDAINSYLDVNHSCTFASFMRAIYACLKDLKETNKKKEVILPRFSCPTFAHAILESGLKIKYCDVNPNTLSFDLEILHKMNFENVLAIISVNHFGLANPMDEILNLCKKKDIYLIEDLGYSLGAEFKNKKLGTFGDFSVLNFKEGKAIPIGGGMVTTRHENIMNHFNNGAKEKSNIFKMFGYKFVTNPYNYFLFKKITKLLKYDDKRRFSMEDTIRYSTNEYDYRFDSNKPLRSISDFQGALGVSILSKMDEHIKMREKNATILEAELSRLNNISIIQKEPRTGRVHYIRYPVLVRKRMRKQILTELLKQGIGASVIYQEVKPDTNKFPGAAKVSREILTLPCHPKVNEEDLKKTVHTIKAFNK